MQRNPMYKRFVVKNHALYTYHIKRNGMRVDYRLIERDQMRVERLYCAQGYPNWDVKVGDAIGLWIPLQDWMVFDELPTGGQCLSVGGQRYMMIGGRIFISEISGIADRWNNNNKRLTLHAEFRIGYPADYSNEYEQEHRLLIPKYGQIFRIKKEWDYYEAPKKHASAISHEIDADRRKMMMELHETVKHNIDERLIHFLMSGNRRKRARRFAAGRQCMDMRTELHDMLKGKSFTIRLSDGIAYRVSHFQALCYGWPEPGTVEGQQLVSDVRLRALLQAAFKREENERRRQRGLDLLD